MLAGRVLLLCNKTQTQAQTQAPPACSCLGGLFPVLHVHIVHAGQCCRGGCLYVFRSMCIWLKVLTGQ